jgi:site-specific DNA-adenine methylase
MRPFFSFFGSKWRVAPHYPKPTHNTIIEPFAGSAGYTLRYPNRNVRLYDADPIICGVWDFLLRAASEEIRRLPLVFSHIDELHGLPGGEGLNRILVKQRHGAALQIPQ